LTPQLAQDRGNVIAGGALADAETLADIGVIEALCDADRDVGMISPLVAPDGSAYSP
jgi:hypothetical protein